MVLPTSHEARSVSRCNKQSIRGGYTSQTSSKGQRQRVSLLRRKENQFPLHSPRAKASWAAPSVELKRSSFWKAQPHMVRKQPLRVEKKGAPCCRHIAWGGAGEKSKEVLNATPTGSLFTLEKTVLPDAITLPAPSSLKPISAVEKRSFCPESLKITH